MVAGVLMGLQFVGLNVNPGRFLRSVDRAQVGGDTFGDVRERVGRDCDLRGMRVDFVGRMDTRARVHTPVHAWTITRPQRRGTPMIRCRKVIADITLITLLSTCDGIFFRTCTGEPGRPSQLSTRWIKVDTRMRTTLHRACDGTLDWSTQPRVFGPSPKTWRDHDIRPRLPALLAFWRRR